MTSLLNTVGVNTLEELIKNEGFIRYCERFEDLMMENFRDKVESYLIYKMKERKNETTRTTTK